MVEKDQTALNVGAFNGFPGDKYQSMFLTYVVPNQGVDMDVVEETLREEIQRVKDGDITSQELERAKTNLRANFIRGLDSNQGLAMRFAASEAIHGSWERVFEEINMLEAVTMEDIQRVANTYLIKKNRTVGMIQTASEEDEKEVAQAD
jgi:predicted Zn-dependent peptidase